MAHSNIIGATMENKPITRLPSASEAAYNLSKAMARVNESMPTASVALRRLNALSCLLGSPASGDKGAFIAILLSSGLVARNYAL